jgi:hypothetical protein
MARLIRRILNRQQPSLRRSTYVCVGLDGTAIIV